MESGGKLPRIAAARKGGEAYLCGLRRADHEVG